jgi:hypothetical protein
MPGTYVLILYSPLFSVLSSVTGLSFEFLAYNVTGFIFYSIYSTISQPHSTSHDTHPITLDC